MKITKVTSGLLSVPTGKRISDSIHSLDKVEVVTCTVETNDGTRGLGYTYTIGTGGYAIKAIIDTVYSKRLAGKDPSETASLWKEMWESTHAVSRGGVTAHAMAAVDIALWDIKGKEVSRPLYWLLGGSKRPIPLYDTNGGWLHYSTEELVRAAKAVARKGFHGFKIKVGKKVMEDDVQRVRAVREALGDGTSIMVDANQVWKAPEAIRRGRKFQDLGVEWYEEPVVADDLLGHRDVARSLDLPIAAGETIFTKYEFEAYIRLGACDIVQPDVCRVGGITEWMQVADLALANGLRVSPHFVMDLHPSLVCSISNGMYVEYIPWLRKLFEHPPEIQAGSILPSDAPGVGLQLRKDSAKYVVR